MEPLKEQDASEILRDVRTGGEVGMNDRKITISNLETNIRWIEDIPCHQFPGWGNVTMAMRDALELLKEQEPKTGKWILDDEDANSWECSECGGLLIINDGTPHENDWYFCPYCGSKLE